MPETCDYTVQFRNMRSGECTNAKRLCQPGDAEDTCCSLGLETTHTKTQDSVCYRDTVNNNLPCPAGTHFMLRPLELDANGVVLRPMLCRLLQVCSANQYELRAPGPTQDRVCVYKTDCGTDLYYEAQPATATSDSICMLRTRYALPPPSACA